MKKQFIYTSLALFLGLGACAQNPTAIKFSQSINKDNAYKHLSVLASDEYEGRETGKKGGWMAAEYIRNHFKALGLKGPVNGGSYFQPINLSSYVVSETILTVNGEAKEALKDFVLSATSVTNEGFTFNNKPVIFVGSPASVDAATNLAGLNLSGKVLMVFADKSVADRATMRKRIQDLQAKAAYLSDQKAAAMLIVDASLDNITPRMKENFVHAQEQLLLKTASNLEKAKNKKSVPTITISTETANSILKEAGLTVDALQKQVASATATVTKEVNVALCASAVRKENKLRAENVLGYLEGSDPVLKNELVVITAHYDHIGLTESGDDKVNNGADDDGSGTTGVLMLAEAFTKAKKAGKGPKRSILFMTVVGEEKGLLGSEWYSENPVFPMKNTITNLNIDMIGRIDADHKDNPDYIYIIGSDMLSSDLNALGIKANKDYINMNLDMRYNNRTDPNMFYYRSDHYNFAKHGVPVIFYFNGVHPEYHQPGDEIGLIDFPKLARRAQLVYYTAWELANGAKRPLVDKNEDGTPIK